MSIFLNLSRIVINKNHVLALSKGHGKYIVHLSCSIDGRLITGSGSIEAECNAVEICEKKNSADYQKVTSWITTL